MVSCCPYPCTLDRRHLELVWCRTGRTSSCSHWTTYWKSISLSLSQMLLCPFRFELFMRMHDCHPPWSQASSSRCLYGSPSRVSWWKVKSTVVSTSRDGSSPSTGDHHWTREDRFRTSLDLTRPSRKRCPAATMSASGRMIQKASTAGPSQIGGDGNTETRRRFVLRDDGDDTSSSSSSSPTTRRAPGDCNRDENVASMSATA
jgi:hypothetical protein